jgi:WD40 repeat protein
LYPWDPVSGQQHRVLEGRSSGASSVCFSPDGGIVAGIIKADKKEAATLHLWNAATGTPRKPIDTGVFDVEQVVFSPAQPWFAVRGAKLANIVVHDAETGKLVYTLDTHGEVPQIIAFSTDGTRLAAGAAGGKVLVWNASTGAELAPLVAKIGDVSEIAFTPDGRRLAVAGADALAVWDLRKASLEHCMPGRFLVIACSDDGGLLAASSRPNRFVVWDLKPQAPAKATPSDFDQHARRARYLTSTYQYHAPELKKCLIAMAAGQPALPIAAGQPSDWCEVTLNTMGAGIDVVRFVSPLDGPGDFYMAIAEPGPAFDWNIVGAQDSVSMLLERRQYLTDIVVPEITERRRMSLAITARVAGMVAGRNEYLMWFAFDTTQPVTMRFRISLIPKNPGYLKTSYPTQDQIGIALGLRSLDPMGHFQGSTSDPDSSDSKSRLRFAPGVPLSARPLLPGE